ncbi:MAG: hypothetical protein IKB02_05335 [Clostridia bacterium]|nr:hypothetical protein [Clostridia bacterium]
MTEETVKITENSLNELIAKAVEGGGFVYLMDENKTNDFCIRLTRPIKIRFYGGHKGESNAE